MKRRSIVNEHPLISGFLVTLGLVNLQQMVLYRYGLFAQIAPLLLGLLSTLVFWRISRRARP